MPNIKASTLLIWGEHDTATPLCDAKIMENLIKDSGLVVLKNAGHFSFLEKTYEVNLIINSFLNPDKIT
jgi:pimeloyl-ACP methyl ester carboxylesterase